MELPVFDDVFMHVLNMGISLINEKINPCAGLFFTLKVAGSEAGFPYRVFLKVAEGLFLIAVGDKKRLAGLNRLVKRPENIQ